MSIFYPTDKPILSYLFLECFGRAIEADPEVSLLQAIKVAAKASGISITERDYEDVSARLQKIATPKPTTPPAATSQKQSKLFQEYNQWLNALPNESQCLIAADGNFEAARHLYCSLDHEAAKAVIAVRCEQHVKLLRAQFESVLYGMGGHLGDDPVSAEVGSTNTGLTDGDAAKQAAAWAELKSLGF